MQRIKNRLKKLESYSGFKTEDERMGYFSLAQRMIPDITQDEIQCPEDVIEILRAYYRQNR